MSKPPWIKRHRAPRSQRKAFPAVGERVFVQLGREWQPAKVTAVFAEERMLSIASDDGNYELPMHLGDYLVRWCYPSDVAALP